MRLHEPYNKLKGALRERGMTYDDISKLLGISKATLCRKINGESDFYMSEADKLESKGFSRKIFYPLSFEYNNKKDIA
jgi:hypothetical protein